MAKVITECSGAPANDAERKAIGFLRDHLSESWLIYHNFEMRQGKEVFEIDIAILAAHAVYLVDVKGTRGLIDVYGSKWYPEGRQPFYSPRAKLDKHAKTLAAIIRESNPALPELRKAHVHATVLLTADDAKLTDHTGKDGPDVTDLKRCLKYFNDKSRIPGHRLNNIQRFFNPIARVITGKAKPQNSPPTFGHWQVEEKLGGTDHYTEYRAKHSLSGRSIGFARIRVYSIDPFLPEAERNEEYLKISNAYRAVAHMTVTPHPNLLPVKDIFDTEGKDKIILVTDDVRGQSLSQHIKKPGLALTFDQKLQAMHDILSALDHAHKHEVIHRNLTPDAVIITPGGRARVTAFDFARVGKNRTSTIAGQIVDDLDANYQAPECDKDPREACIASDIYSAGVIFYQLLTGELPFEDVEHMMEADGKFPVKPSEHKPGLHTGFDKWLQGFCEFDAEDRYPSAAVARKALDGLILPGLQTKTPGSKDTPDTPAEPIDLTDLQRDHPLDERFLIKKKLGSGNFSVVYIVFDLLCDTNRVLKLVIKDRLSVYERLRQEYTILQQTEKNPHPNVVKVIWADRLNDNERTPYIVFEHINGLDVSDLIEVKGLSVEDAAAIAKQTAEGLKYLHELGIYHQDIKPQNLLLTDHGIKIIDFNVAASEKKEVQSAGGTRRYLAPDYDTSVEPSAESRIDRDIYALGITFYECLSGHYPFEETEPPLKKPPRDLKQFKGCSDLSSSLLRVVYKMIAPMRKDRYASASAFLEDFSQLKGKYRSLFSTGELNGAPRTSIKPGFQPDRPNVNPFVSHLLTLYSQSRISNAGTRGLDEIGKATYISTYLDEKLLPLLLKGEFRLVIISGNAGDGKTAFIQQLETFAESKGAQIQRGANGAVFQQKGHTFQSNYDGSQDEGDEGNDEVLQKFFAPFKGDNAEKWPTNQTRIIAINEGRLVDFFLEYQHDFPLLAEAVDKGLTGQAHFDGVSVINLNLRSIVADQGGGKGSILEQTIKGMTRPEYWRACENCDLAKKCYAYHNARTFQDPNAGPKIIERLKLLYTITHFRGRLHITMRDLRSALAYMLAGTLDCDGIHRLYHGGGEEDRDRILDGFYFNSWLGGGEGSNDRLVSLLREIDIARVSNPALDRGFAFLKPGFKSMSRFSFPDRHNYDEQLLEKQFANLPRDFSSTDRGHHIDAHRTYLSHLRRRHFFECRSTRQAMLPYSSINQFIKIVQNPGERNVDNIRRILRAVNRGEGLSEPDGLGNQLALRVRKVARGTIRSYRLFDGEKFSLDIETGGDSHPFIECLPQHLLLSYNPGDGQGASLTLNLDVFEMLMRLNNGYRPNVEEEEGFYLSLSVFKNILSAAPYREVLLTESGFEFYRIRRDDNGVLHMDNVNGRSV
ncbi:MAG: protein kinase [bacterium]|nr:protein kinase [bacterium]